MLIKPKNKSLSNPVSVNRKGDFEGKSGWIGKRERGVMVFYPDSDFELVPEYKSDNIKERLDKLEKTVRERIIRIEKIYKVLSRSRMINNNGDEA